MLGFLKKKLDEFRKSGKVISIESFEDDFYDFLFEIAKYDIYPESVEKYKEEILNLVRKNKKISYLDVFKLLKNIIEKNYKKFDLEDLIKNIKKKRPYVIMFLGFNGHGKTTNLVKLGYFLKSKGFKVLLVAADTFRVAAIEQLEKLAKEAGLDLFKLGYKVNPTVVALKALEKAKKEEYDVVLIDTAGRSYEDYNLMQELKSLYEKIKPDLTVLVLEAIGGSDLINQYTNFNKFVEVNSIVFSKFDLYNKEGSILSLLLYSMKPILFLGVGESLEDIKPFNLKEFLGKVF